MNNYLKGYLASIPKYDYDKIITYLTEIMTIYLPEIDLVSVLASISKNQTPTVSAVTLNQYQKASIAYNETYSKVYIDLLYLYKVIDLLYAAVSNYSDLSSSYIAEINSEIDRIQVVLTELQTRESYRENVFTVIEEFKTKNGIEDNSIKENYYLYVDRDNTPLPLCDILSTNIKSYATLRTRKEKDLIRSINGDVQSRIFVRDYCGKPLTENSIYALDSSKYTYWDTSVYSKSQIATVINGTNIYGSWIKFVVQLPKISNITNIEVMPYGIDPVHIKISVNDQMVYDGETNDVAYVFIKEAASDEVTIELLQENYIFKTITFNEKETEAIDLWNSKLEDKDIYADYIDRYRKEMDYTANYWEHLKYE